MRSVAKLLSTPLTRKYSYVPPRVYNPPVINCHKLNALKLFRDNINIIVADYEKAHNLEINTANSLLASETKTMSTKLINDITNKDLYGLDKYEPLSKADKNLKIRDTIIAQMNTKKSIEKISNTYLSSEALAATTKIKAEVLKLTNKINSKYIVKPIINEYGMAKDTIVSFVELQDFYDGDIVWRIQHITDA